MSNVRAHPVALTISGLTLVALGVAGFFAGLFGIPQAWSLQASVFGLALLFVGVAVLLFTLRRTRFCMPHVSLFVVVAIAIALHAYEALVKSSGGASLGFFLWSLTPYVLCLIVATVSASSIPAVAGAVTAFLFDLDAHNHVFVHPTSSTAGLALLFVPLWNTLVFSPVAMLGAWLLLRLRPSAKANAP
jgi:hypothetical protein